MVIPFISSAPENFQTRPRGDSVRASGSSVVPLRFLFGSLEMRVKSTVGSLRGLFGVSPGSPRRIPTTK